jgi:hypothetical protein
VACACGCGATFSLYDAIGRPRRYVSGHNPPVAATQTAIIRILSDAPRPLTLGELRRQTNLSIAALKACLTKVVKQGAAVRVARGTYWRRGDFPVQPSHSG